MKKREILLYAIGLIGVIILAPLMMIAWLFAGVRGRMGYGQ